MWKNCGEFSFFVSIRKAKGMAKIIGAGLIIAGFAIGWIAFNQRSSWVTLPLDQKVQLILQQSIRELAKKNAIKSPIRTWKVQVHSQTLLFLLKGRSINRIINSAGTHDLEVDIFDIVTDDRIQGFVAQTSLINVKTKNKEGEFSENIDLNELNQETHIFSGSPIKM